MCINFYCNYASDLNHIIKIRLFHELFPNLNVTTVFNFSVNIICQLFDVIPFLSTVL